MVKDRATPAVSSTPLGRAGGALSSLAPTVDISHLAKKTSVDTARDFGIIGLIVGALGLPVAVVAVTRGRPQPAQPRLSLAQRSGSRALAARANLAP